MDCLSDKSNDFKDSNSNGNSSLFDESVNQRGKHPLVTILKCEALLFFSKIYLDIEELFKAVKLCRLVFWQSYVIFLDKTINKIDQIQKKTSQFTKARDVWLYPNPSVTFKLWLLFSSVLALKRTSNNSMVLRNPFKFLQPISSFNSDYIFQDIIQRLRKTFFPQSYLYLPANLISQDTKEGKFLIRF